MKKVLFLAVALLFILQTVAFAETKIGAISMQSILINSAYGKAMNARMKAKFEPMQKDIEKEALAIQKLESELKNQDLALKLEAKQDKQREYRRKVRDHQDSVMAFRQKVQQEQQKQQQPVLQKILKVINEYGKAHGYSMIVEMSNVALYVDSAVDLTDKIIAELDKLKKAEK